MESSENNKIRLARMNICEHVRLNYIKCVLRHVV